MEIAIGVFAYELINYISEIVTLVGLCTGNQFYDSILLSMHFHWFVAAVGGGGGVGVFTYLSSSSSFSVFSFFFYSEMNAYHQ